MRHAKHEHTQNEIAMMEFFYRLTSNKKMQVMFTNIEELHLQFNQLTILPNEIGNFTQLKMLLLYRNELQCLPKEIGQLMNLESLVLSDNKLTELPHEIGNLVNLKSLKLYNNRLKKLPDEIVYLTNLVDFIIDENSNLILTEIQKRFIEKLMHNGCNVVVDKDLFIRF